MTIIASMEALEQVPVGEVITVGPRTNLWERIEDGWKRGQFILSSDHFAAEVLGGAVTQGAAQQVGQVWQRGDTYHLIVTQEGSTDSQAWVVYSFTENDGGAPVWQARRRYNIVPGRIAASRPAWADRLYTLCVEAETQRTTAQDWRRASQESERQRAEQEEAHRREITTLRENVERTLHAYMTENNIDPMGDLGTMLAENGMRRPTKDVEVTAQLDVSAYVTIPVETILSLLPEGAENPSTTPSQVTASWRMERKFTVQAEAGACACDRLRRTRVYQEVTDMGFNPYAVYYTASCESPDHIPQRTRH